MSEALCCVPVQLPEDQIQESIAIAYSFNPANRIPTEVAKPAHLAVLKTSYWGPKGVKLGVTFLESVSNEFKSMFLAHANAWAKSANIEFKNSSQGEVRVTLTPGKGYWSYLGTDILSIRSGPTMNLERFTVNTPVAEWKRVVRHEVGHTLGFPHEHMKKEIIDKIDVQKAYSYFQKNVGWNKSMVDSQVLTPLNPSTLITTKGARENSIMCYQLPASIMKDGKAVTGGNDIDLVDYALAQKLYPRMN